jgi:hypothetical protein
MVQKQNIAFFICPLCTFVVMLFIGLTEPTAYTAHGDTWQIFHIFMNQNETQPGVGAGCICDIEVRLTFLCGLRW